MNRDQISHRSVSQGPAAWLATWLRRGRCATDEADSVVLPTARDVPGAQSMHMREVRLDIDNDRHARAAVQAYADSCESEMPWLATVLRERLKTRQDSPECAETVWRLFHVAWRRAQQNPDYSKNEWNHVREVLVSVLERGPVHT
jgi:hypothetical protein